MPSPQEAEESSGVQSQTASCSETGEPHLFRHLHFCRCSRLLRSAPLPPLRECPLLLNMPSEEHVCVNVYCLLCSHAFRALMLIMSLTSSQIHNFHENISVCPRKKPKHISECPIYVNLLTAGNEPGSSQLINRLGCSSQLT